MALFKKPDWLEFILSLFNWPEGDWIDISILGWGIKLPPFDFMPGDLIEDALDILIGWINTAFDLAVEAWDLAYSAGKDAVEALGKIDDWLSGATGWFATQVANWWDATGANVIDWITDAVKIVLAWVQKGFDELLGFIDTLWLWVGDFTIWVVDELKLYVTKLDLADILRPVLDFMDFVETVKQEIVDFFNDPWDFLYKKFDDFFERFW